MPIRCLSFLCFYLFFPKSTCMTSDDWSLRFNDDESDFLIGGIFSVRGTMPGSHNCTDINPFYVIQSEALVYAIKVVNDNILKPYNLSVGVIGFDACDNTQIAYQKGIIFIEGKETGLCLPDGQPTKPQETVCKCVNESEPQVHIVTGSITSDMAVGLSPLFQYFCIPLISSYSSSDSLTEDEDSYFLRTIPPNAKLIEALMQVLLNSNWTRVNIVYEQTAYGNDLHHDFMEYNRILGNPICVINDKDLSAKQWPSPQNLGEWHEDTPVLLLLADYLSATDFLKLVNRTGLKFQFVGSDGWSSMCSVVDGVETAAENAITLEPLLKENPGFRDYLANLTLNNTINQWMKALISSQNDCETNCSTSGCFRRRMCDSDEKLQMDQVEPMAIQRSHFVIEVVDLFARAIESIYEDLGEEGLERKSQSGVRQIINGKNLLHKLLNTTLNDSLAQFKWDNRSGPPDYSVMQFSLNTSNRKYEWYQLGEYTNGKLMYYSEPKLNASLMSSISDALNSCQNCHGPDKDLQMSSCCNSCCQPDQYLVEGLCQQCEEHHHAVKNKCVRWPSMIFFNHDGYNMTLFILSLLGLVFSTALLIFLLVKRETPIVRVQFGRLGLLLVSAVGCLFLVSALSLTCAASKALCTANVYIWSLALTVAFSVLCGKVLRMDACNNLERSEDFPYRFLSIDKEKMIRSILIGSLVVFHFIFFMWLGYTKCESITLLPDIAGDSQFLVCAVMRDPISLVNLLPSLILIITTIIFGYRGRDSILVVFRQESKQSLIAAFGVIFSFFFAMPIQFITKEAEVIGIATASRALIPALAILLVCLIPPAFIILRRPDKNTYASLQRKVVVQRRKGGGGVFLITIESFQTQLRRKMASTISASTESISTISHRPSAKSVMSDYLSSTGSSLRSRVKSEGEKDSTLVNFSILNKNSIRTKRKSNSDRFSATSMPDIHSITK